MPFSGFSLALFLPSENNDDSPFILIFSRTPLEHLPSSFTFSLAKCFCSHFSCIYCHNFVHMLSKFLSLSDGWKRGFFHSSGYIKNLLKSDWNSDKNCCTSFKTIVQDRPTCEPEIVLTVKMYGYFELNFWQKTSKNV